MSQENIERLKRESSAMNWVVGLVAALLVYVVSPMTVVKVIRASGVNVSAGTPLSSIFATVYWPIIEAGERFDVVREFYDWEAKMLRIN